MTKLYLCESSLGFGLFKAESLDETTITDAEQQRAFSDFSRVARAISLVSFEPFKTPKEALDAVNHISEGSLPSSLVQFLDAHVPSKTRKKAVLAISDHRLGGPITEALSLKCVCNAASDEVIRIIRQFLCKFVDLNEADRHRADVGLGHAYSRSKLMFDVNRSDNMIIQASAILDMYDKNINSAAMRVKEWYAWHFPELTKLVPDILSYAKAAAYLGPRDSIEGEGKTAEGLLQATSAEGFVDEAKAAEILEVAKVSMGLAIGEADAVNLNAFCERIVSMCRYRDEMRRYLDNKIASCCPSLGQLMGNQVAARLVSHAGSLINLAKAPASTIQILGAEKALFRALKTKQNTPKYGLIFHCSFIGRAAKKDKGKMSRYVANKAAIASRLDAFSETVSPIFGEVLRGQCEDRLSYYADGGEIERNEEVMERALSRVREATAGAGGKKEKKDKKDKEKKRQRESSGADADETPAASEKLEKKKSRKSDATDTERSERRSKSKSR